MRAEQPVHQERGGGGGGGRKHLISLFLCPHPVPQWTQGLGGHCAPNVGSTLQNSDHAQWGARARTQRGPGFESGLPTSDCPPLERRPPPCASTSNTGEVDSSRVIVPRGCEDTGRRRDPGVPAGARPLASPSPPLPSPGRGRGAGAGSGFRPPDAPTSIARVASPPPGCSSSPEARASTAGPEDSPWLPGGPLLGPCPAPAWHPVAPGQCEQDNVLAPGCLTLAAGKMGGDARCHHPRGRPCPRPRAPAPGPMKAIAGGTLGTARRSPGPAREGRGG